MLALPMCSPPGRTCVSPAPPVCPQLLQKSVPMSPAPSEQHPSVPSTSRTTPLGPQHLQNNLSLCPQYLLCAPSTSRAMSPVSPAPPEQHPSIPSTFATTPAPPAARCCPSPRGHRRAHEVWAPLPSSGPKSPSTAATPRPPSHTSSLHAHPSLPPSTAPKKAGQGFAPCHGAVPLPSGAEFSRGLREKTRAEGGREQPRARHHAEGQRLFIPIGPFYF